MSGLVTLSTLYALGMSYEAICEHLSDLYGLEVSPAKISQVTDKYPIFFLDAMHFKVRLEGKFPEAIAQVVPKTEYKIRFA